MDKNKKTKTIFYNQKSVLEDMCVICYEKPKRGKACQQCLATICDTCLFEFLDVYKLNKCPNCRTEMDEESMLDAWQLRYVNNKTKDKIRQLTEQITTLQLQKQKKFKETTKNPRASIQLQVHRWVNKHLLKTNINNEKFNNEIQKLENLCQESTEENFTKIPRHKQNKDATKGEGS